MVVNGGQDVGGRVGDEFVVRGAPREVTDPVSGNPIDAIPGKVLGRIRVEEVKATSAYGALLEGAAGRGDVLETAK
mgnify:CR=1 FL=1